MLAILICVIILTFSMGMVALLAEIDISPEFIFTVAMIVLLLGSVLMNGPNKDGEHEKPGIQQSRRIDPVRTVTGDGFGGG